MNNVDIAAVSRVWIADDWEADWVADDELRVPYAEERSIDRDSHALLRRALDERKLENETEFTEPEQKFYADKYVLIELTYPYDNEDPEYQPEQIFVGRILDDDFQVDGSAPGAGDVVFPNGWQFMHVAGLDYDLERQRIDHAFVWDAVWSETRRINWSPDANRASSDKRGNFLPRTLGNRSENVNEDGVYVFADPKSLRGNHHWTGKTLLEYLLKYFTPVGQEWVLAGQKEALDNIIEIVKLEGKTVRQVIREVIRMKRGVTARIEYDEETNEIKLVIKTIATTAIAVGTYTLPANDEQDSLIVPDAFPFSHLVGTFGFRVTKLDRYRSITVQGNRILVACPFGGGMMTKGWRTADEIVLPAGSTGDAPATRDQKEVEDLRFRDVYVKHVVIDDWSGLVPGPLVNTTSARSAIPICDDDGNVTFDAANVPSDRARAFMRFENWLPIKETKDFTADDPGSLQDAYLKPQLFERNPSTGFKNLMTQVRRASSGGASDDVGVDRETMRLSIEVLDDQAGYRVQVQPQHYLAKGSWLLFDGDGRPTTAIEPKVDYRDLVCVLAFRTDDRQRLKSDADEDALQDLVITLESAEYWYVVPGTLYGTREGSTGIVTSGNAVRRNDKEFLQRTLCCALAWYTGDRRAVVIPIKRLKKWRKVGSMITTVELAGWEPIAANTVVTGLRYEIDPLVAEGGIQQMTIETGFDSLDFMPSSEVDTRSNVIA